MNQLTLSSLPRDADRHTHRYIPGTLFVTLLLWMIALPLPAAAQSSPDAEDERLFLPSVTRAGAETPRVDAAAASELFFSEYIEGSGFNKVVEIYNGTGASVDLAAGLYTLELYTNGSPTASQSAGLAGAVADGDVFVVSRVDADPAIVAVADALSPAVINFNGDDAVVLRKNGAIVDVIGQIGFDPGSEWGTGAASTADNTIRRKATICAGDANGSDPFDPAVEWDGFANNTLDGLGTHSANCANSDPAPTVIATTPANGASGVAADANLDITFSEPVNAGGNSFTISCTSGARTAVVSGGPTTFTLNPDSDFASGDVCTVTVVAANVTDQDSNDPPDAMAADSSFGFSAVISVVTPIHTVQGSGADVTPGAFMVEGIVVGDYQTQGSGQLRGFFLQEEDGDADADPTTSEGIFVFCANCPTAVAVGDKVRVIGAASDFFGMSQLTASTAESVSVVSSNNPLPTPATINLPVPGLPSGDLAAATAAINAYYEPFEGMLVTFPATLAVSEYFELARYNQVILTAGGRPRQFTADNAPSAAGMINHEIALAGRTVILDDTNNRQNFPIDPPNTPYYYPTPGLSTGNFMRGGDTITNLTGVLHWSFAGQTGTDAWRIRPVSEKYSYVFTPANPRPTVPNPGGRVKVASFNVLNYFLTVDTTSSNDVGVCGAGMTLDCRGADSAQELERQRAKLTQALLGLNADVVGLIELENTPNVAPQLQIVSDLNAIAGAGSYAFVDTGVIGTDAIKVGLIYKPAKVTPVGPPLIDNNPVHNRPPVAQLFATPDGARFVVVVNHFKSKGCTDATGADLDQLDGQGCFNAQRTAQAEALADFVNSVIIQTGEPDVLLIGDLNSYAKEDPVTTLQSAGYHDLVAAFGGGNAYSYLFDGQLGYLDHALASASLKRQVTGATDWHINADEVPLFDYNDEVADPGEASFEEESDALPLYSADPYRTSDHDPVLVGLKLNTPPICKLAVASRVLLLVPNHRFVDIHVLGVIDPERDPITITIDRIFQDEAVNAAGSGNTAPDGQGIGTATAEVRAERAGSGNGRVYHIFFTARDPFGGACSDEVRVGVPQNLTRLPGDGGARYDSTLAVAGAAGLESTPGEAQDEVIFLPLLRQ